MITPETEFNYVPVVASLEDVTPIPGADRIVSATARGYSGSLGVYISEEDAAEAIGEICVRAHDARLTHCDTDSQPWPDAQGPWRLEIPLAALED